MGQGAIVGGLAAVTRDVIPYGSAWGNHAQLHGLNLIGLKRKGYDKTAIRRLLAAYRDLFEGQGEFAGGCFSPDGKWFFINLQSRGLTLAVTGPWEKA